MTDSEQYYIVAQQQSRIFYCEAFQTIYRLIQQETNVKLLDVGPATGAGAALLQDLFHPQGFVTVKVEVTALDIANTHEQFARTTYPQIKYLVGDVESLPDKSYDFVFSSHTIEHIADPYKFVENLRRVSRGRVLILCPYNEHNRIPGHVVTIGDYFINVTKPLEYTVYKSAGWTGQCVALVY